MLIPLSTELDIHDLLDRALEHLDPERSKRIRDGVAKRLAKVRPSRIDSQNPATT